MIPILYPPDEVRFITNGIGRLSDCTRCIVTEVRNGIFECEFDYPLTGIHFDEIKYGRIVGCTHDDNHDIQPFVIYSRSISDLNGIVTFYAHHISYRLNDVVIMPFTASSAADAMSKIVPNSVNVNPFTFWTDKTTAGTYEVSVPKTVRSILGGEEGSILDVFGAGDYKFDRFDVKLYAHRGVDSDVEIRYSKNLISLQETVDAGSTYNAVVPYWADSEGNLVTLPEMVLVYSGAQPVLAYLTDHNLIVIRTETDEPIEVAYTEINAVPMDMSSDFEEMPSVNDLRTAARNKFESSYAWLPDENLTVDFVQLWQTEEFKDYAAIQRVSLCDTVSVYYPQAGISKVKQRVVKVVYNVLMDRYDSIELGKVQSSLGETIRSEILQEVPTTSMMDAAIQYATDLIRGGLGGYVVMTPGPNGYPQEILIMDTPDVNTAVNVWRFNQGGLGHSHSGYEGPFDDIALTQDGKINASMITAGILNANIIQAGTISDSSGVNFWNLVSGQFQTKQGKLGNFTINSSGLAYSSGNNKASIDNSGISFGDSTKGISIDATRMAFKAGSSGSLSNVALLDVDTNGVGLSALSGKRLYLGSYGGSSGGLTIFPDNSIVILSNTEIWNSLQVNGGLTVLGTKSRSVKTDSYSERLLYAYETPTPLFGDIGESVIDEEGLCYIDLDDIFSETITARVEYQVFLQKEGEGDCWITEKNPRYFVISGTPGLKVAWELKAKQRDYELIRLEKTENGLEEYAHEPDPVELFNDYISEQEGLLYG